ncbi:hypothetical protein [Aurantimonas sp. A3-2-R12]|uniref:hypothetical protein n=1 Tax=Aurantimonas sp. A3-2-R12 TaxID=3114362 RepID=UPI002E17B03B|nr:hypothetical protein [Aurantimonas sp. A3-2-R12]
MINAIVVGGTVRIWGTVAVDPILRFQPAAASRPPDNPSGDLDCHRQQFTVRFEERLVEDLSFPRQTEAFERVAAVSETNEAMESARKARDNIYEQTFSLAYGQPAERLAKE